jgi:hypothetical protein
MGRLTRDDPSAADTFTGGRHLSVGLVAGWLSAISGSLLSKINLDPALRIVKKSQAPGGIATKIHGCFVLAMVVTLLKPGLLANIIPGFPMEQDSAKFHTSFLLSAIFLPAALSLHKATSWQQSISLQQGSAVPAVFGKRCKRLTYLDFCRRSPQVRE